MLSPLAYYAGFVGILLGFIALARYNRQLAPMCRALIWLTMTLMTGLRVGVGRDYMVYINVYTDPLSDSALFVEYTWKFIIHICRDLLGLSIHTWLTLIAGVTYACIFRAFERWRIDWTIGILIYVMIHHGYFYSMSAVRQALAMSIVFIASADLYRGRGWRFVIITLIAGCLHSSAFTALLTLPLVSIRWNKTFFALTLLGSFAIGAFLLIPMIELVRDYMPQRYAIYLEGDLLLTERTTGTLQYFLNLAALLALVWYRPTGQSGVRDYLPMQMFVLSICIYNVFISLEPGMRLMYYPYLGLFPLVVSMWHSGERRRELYAFLLVGGLFAFAFKDMINPRESYRRYRTIFEQTMPHPIEKTNPEQSPPPQPL